MLFAEMPGDIDRRNGGDFSIQKTDVDRVVLVAKGYECRYCVLSHFTTSNVVFRLGPVWCRYHYAGLCFTLLFPPSRETSYLKRKEQPP